MLQHTKLKQNQRLREGVMFQSLPPQPKSVDDKDCEVVGVHRPAAPRYEWSATGTTQWMKHGNDKHANCWGYSSYDHFNSKKVDQT